MLHIILTILKIVGMILLFLLLLLFFLASLFFFLPLRYRAQAQKDTNWKQATFHGKLTWFFGIFSFYVIYENAKFQCYLQIFKKKSFLTEEDTSKANTKKEKKSKEDEDEFSFLQEETTENHAFNQKETQKENHLSKTQTISTEDSASKTQDHTVKKENVTQKSSRKFKKTIEKLEKYFSFLRSDSTKEVTKTLKEHFLYLCFHIRPRKIKGKIHYGLGDPANTGWLTGILYCLLPARCKDLSLEPDFQKAICEGEIFLSGHICLCHFAVIAWKIIFDKRLRQSWKNLKQLRRNG